MYSRLLAIFLLIFATQIYGYTTQLHAPAVLVGVDRGVLTNITLNVTPGNGTILVNPASSGTVGSDTRASAVTAVGYATSFLNIDENSYNYRFQIGDNNSNVSGPSAGLALTLLTISGLEHTHLNSNFTLTGTISANGTVGPIGGVFDKLQAAKTINARFMLVPYVSNQSQDYLIYYLSQQTYGIPVIEVKNVSQAIPYAFGNAQPVPLQYNISTNYHIGQLQNASAVCPSCNGTLFSPLANFTFNLTSGEISQLNSTHFAAIKSQFANDLSQYRQLASKGYLYTGADLAFLEYQSVYVFLNYNASQQSAYNLMQNISYYCNSLNYTPQTTQGNYELIVGAQTRLAWARIRLQEALAALNASQTSDEVLLSLEAAAPAQSWCAAAHEMYAQAATINGTPVTTSQTITRQAQSQLQQAQEAYGNQELYVQAANYSISNKEYAAALYSLGYANVFYNDSAAAVYNSTHSNISATVSKTLSSASGIWPSEFALQGYFYLRESALQPNGTSNSTGYLSNAYYTAQLASTLEGINSQIQTNFVSAPLQQNSTSSGPIQQQINQLSSQISLLFYTLVIILVLIAVIFVMLLLILLRGSGKARSAPRPAKVR